MKEFKIDLKNGDKTITVDIAPIKIKKGKGMGGEYLAPKNVSSLDADFLFSIFPKDAIINKIIRPKFKQFCSVITNEAASEAGKITEKEAEKLRKKGKNVVAQPIQDEDKFVEAFTRMFSTLSPRGESKSGLTRAQNELLGEFGDLDENAPDYQERSIAIFKEIKRIREALDAKRTDDDTDEDESETEEANKEAVAA